MHSRPKRASLATLGRVVTLLSAGIDSPVAAWLMMKRGVVPYFLHINTRKHGGNAIEACTMQIISSLNLVWIISVDI